MSYFSKYPYVVRKAVSFGRRVGAVFRHTRIFPLDSLRFLLRIVFVGLRAAARGELVVKVYFYCFTYESRNEIYEY
jgi:hypothetical protein